MRGTNVELGADVIELLDRLGDSPARAARELTVLERYRRGAVNGGQAAALLGMERRAFIQCSGDLGIPCFRKTADLAAEPERIAESGR